MADDVSRQQVSVQTLHLRQLRKRWQIIALQVIATTALVWMYMEVISTYVIGYLDHTLVLDQLDKYLVGETSGEYAIPMADWLTGLGSDGMARVYMPITLGVLLGGGMALLSFQPPQRQQRIKFWLIIVMIGLLVGRLLSSWLFGMLFSWEWRIPDQDEFNYLIWPISMLATLMVMGFYLLPIIMGSKGIWGLSRRGVAWAIGFTLFFLAIHAILTFPIIYSVLGSAGAYIPQFDAQVGEATVWGLITPQQGSLILIAILMLIFMESAFGVIRYMEYAFRLPESCKKDPEYVRQMENILNHHLYHTVFFLGITGVSTMVALGFHTILLKVVAGMTGSQWAHQVSESIELQLTYGLVISALLFLLVVAAMRFVVPWQRISGFIEHITSRQRS
ncbi:MAG: hypothetical protein QF707_05520 [Candidatus Poseidoniaceae archaeon]|jgi:hypothetical protein|nr:hypothetical protein [Candidatus Poseidoniaceae archaeon]MDP7203145.1 hypothetical protein [Candidatus Poseidoniaceae archaeon]